MGVEEKACVRERVMGRKEGRKRKAETPQGSKPPPHLRDKQGAKSGQPVGQTEEGRKKPPHDPSRSKGKCRVQQQLQNAAPAREKTRSRRKRASTQLCRSQCRVASARKAGAAPRSPSALAH